MKTDGNIVVLEFDTPLVNVENNPFTSLSTLASDNKTEEERVKLINKTINDKHFEILSGCIDMLEKKMKAAKISGIEIEVKDRVNQGFDNVYTYIVLSKKGVGNCSHIDIFDSIRIDIRSETKNDNIQSEAYRFSLKGNYTDRFTNNIKVFKDYSTMEELMVKSIEYFINKRN